MNEGAILESVGSFEGVSYKDLPKGGWVGKRASHTHHDRPP